jgi:putative ABC transport system ATP-binding protein
VSGELVIRLVNTTKKFIGGEVVTTALNGVSLEIAAGEYVAVTGPSGCGKSTLLTILGMLDSPDAGEYWFDGQDVAGRTEEELNDVRRGRISFIFQSFNLIEELTVEENVELALEYSDVTPAARGPRVAEMLEHLNIAHRAKHRPSQLSGGQQQRVAIARALITQPTLLLADEPTGNLDTAHGEEVMQLLDAINGNGTTIVMVTHSPAHARRAGRTVALLDGALAPEAP